MTLPDWNPDDYHFDFPDVPPYEGTLVGMPIHHKVEKLREFFAGEIMGEIKRSLAADSELAVLILCLAAVDYLAGFAVGRQSRGEDYVGYLNGEFFPEAYNDYARDIYIQLRNGLMHNLTIVNPWRSSGTPFRIEANSENHLMMNAEGQVGFSVATFAEDLRRAFWMYIHALIMRPEDVPHLVQNFHRRFDRLEGRGAFMVRS